MKGILTPDELQAAMQTARLTEPFKALFAVLVNGTSAAQAMRETGVHRTKIAAAKTKVLAAWRQNEAQKN